MMQCECGYSSVFRLSDPEETRLMLRLYNVDETPLAPLMDKLGYKDMERCMFLGFTDGERAFPKMWRRISTALPGGTAPCP